MARLLLPAFGYVKGLLSPNLPLALSLLSLTYLLGLIVIFFMPETKGRPLPDDAQPALAE